MGVGEREGEDWLWLGEALLGAGNVGLRIGEGEGEGEGADVALGGGWASG